MRTVFTNGCFDLLHYGHCDYLRRCRLLGDWLVVAVNSDASVRRLKGDSRPIYPQHDRLVMASSLKYANDVYLFDTEAELAELVARVHPDILVKSSDYAGKPITARNTLPAWRSCRSCRDIPRPPRLRGCANESGILCLRSRIER